MDLRSIFALKLLTKGVVSAGNCFLPISTPLRFIAIDINSE